MPVKFGGPIGPFLDHVQQRQVPVNVFGELEFRTNQPPQITGEQLERWIAGEITRAFRNVIGPKMVSRQLTFADLGTGRIVQLVPEIIATSNLDRHGIQIGNLTAQFSIDGHAPAPHPQHQQQQPQTLQSPQQPQYAVDARINVGGLRIDASSDKGVDMRGLQNQVVDKAKSNIAWYAIGCGILFLVGAGVIGLGLYIWFQARSSMASTSTSSSRTASAAKWDGKSPFTCGGNDTLTISGVKASLSSTAITATGNCNLTLVSCDITAPIAIEAGGNAVVTTTGGSLNGSTDAVHATGLAKVMMSGTSVSGKKEAIGMAKITGP